MGIVVFDNTNAGRIAFNPNTDILSLSGKASDYLLGKNAEGVATLTKGAKTLTLVGTTQEQLISDNFLVLGSEDKILIGDNTASAVNDGLAQGTGGALDLVTQNNNTINGNHLVYGMGGGDTITVGNGDNLIFGGRGLVDAADGSDTIIINGAGAVSGSNRIFANAGDDTVLFTKPTAQGKTSTVWCGAGQDDVITGGAAGGVILYGNAGNDTLNATGSTGTLYLYGGNGTADSTDGGDTLITGLGNATVYGNAGTDYINYDDFALTSTQAIYGGLGNDSVQGDIGGDGSFGSLMLYGNAGGDVLDASTHKGAVTMYGGNGETDSTDGADVMTATSGVAQQITMYGNAGADTVNLLSGLADGGSVRLYAGLGNDVIHVAGARGDTAVLVLQGNAGNDTINLNDALLTEDATALLEGFEKTDTVNVTLNGGTAIDLTVTGQGVSLVVDNGAANGKYAFVNYTGSITDRNMVLSDGSSLQVNTGAKATLTGTANNDQLIAGALGDTLSGAAGNDLLRGGDSADSISGGDGVDTIYGNEGNDTIAAGDGGALGGTYDSLIDGGESADSITGGAFEDSIIGGSGHDTLIGGLGADTLIGGLGNDVYGYAAIEVDALETNVDLITDAFGSGTDRFTFTDLDRGTLRGTGVSFAKGDADTTQTLGANVGFYLATNAVADFSVATLFSELSGVADDLVTGDAFYALFSNGVDARLVRVTEVGGAAGTLTLAGDTLEFVTRLNGVDSVDMTALTVGNFTNFV
jgi:Ca2+-binding RTX toxin-like protein